MDQRDRNYTNVSVTLEQGSTSGSSSSSTNEIEVDLQSTDYDALKMASNDLVTELRKRDDVMQVHSSIENAAPIIKVKGRSGCRSGRGSDACVHRLYALQQFKRCGSGYDESQRRGY